MGEDLKVAEESNIVVSSVADRSLKNPEESGLTLKDHGNPSLSNQPTGPRTSIKDSARVSVLCPPFFISSFFNEALGAFSSSPIEGWFNSRLSLAVRSRLRLFAVHERMCSPAFYPNLVEDTDSVFRAERAVNYYNVFNNAWLVDAVKLNMRHNDIAFIPDLRDKDTYNAYSYCYKNQGFNSAYFDASFLNKEVKRHHAAIAKQGYLITIAEFNAFWTFADSILLDGNHQISIRVYAREHFTKIW